MPEQRITLLVKFEIGEPVVILGGISGVVFAYLVTRNLEIEYGVRRLVDGILYDTYLYEHDLEPVGVDRKAANG